MAVIDSDAHVLETPDSWRFMEGEDRKFVPGIFTQTFGHQLKANDGEGVQSNYWMVGDRTFSKDRNVGNEMSRAIREMEDIPGRIAHMDELGIDVQILYPTIYLRPVTDDIPTELALTRGYNRWLADIYKQADGRLRWAALPPLRSHIDVIRDEMVITDLKAEAIAAERSLPNYTLKTRRPELYAELIKEQVQY